MPDSLTDDQRRQVAMAVTAARAAAVLTVCKGLEPPAALAAMSIALTTIIATSYDPRHRLDVLNKLLGDTINEWATEAAIAEGAGETRQ